MRVKVSFIIEGRIEKDFRDLKNLSNVNTYAKKAFIKKVLDDRKSKKENERYKKLIKRLEIRKKLKEKCPEWLQIDSYDDLGARSSKRKLQDWWDRNPKCVICGIDLQKHVNIFGKTNQDHLFKEENEE